MSSVSLTAHLALAKQFANEALALLGVPKAGLYEREISSDLIDYGVTTVSITYRIHDMQPNKLQAIVEVVKDLDGNWMLLSGKIAHNGHMVASFKEVWESPLYTTKHLAVTGELIKYPQAEPSCTVWLFDEEPPYWYYTERMTGRITEMSLEDLATQLGGLPMYFESKSKWNRLDLERVLATCHTTLIERDRQLPIKPGDIVLVPTKRQDYYTVIYPDLPRSRD